MGVLKASQLILTRGQDGRPEVKFPEVQMLWNGGAGFDPEDAQRQQLQQQVTGAVR